MAQVSRQISVSHPPSEAPLADAAADSVLKNAEAVESAAESAAVLTVTVVEKSGWTLADSLSFGALLMESLVALAAIGLAILAFLGYKSVQDIRQDVKLESEKSAEEKLLKFRDGELRDIIGDAIRAREEASRRKEAVKTRGKMEKDEEKEQN